jgi:hypothetical protein
MGRLANQRKMEQEGRRQEARRINGGKNEGRRTEAWNIFMGDGDGDDDDFV